MQMSADMQRAPNVRLRHCREEMGWTQEDLAAEMRDYARVHDGQEVGVTANMVCRWETGEKATSLRYRRLCRLVFGKTDAELGFADESAPTPLDEMPRRLFLESLGSAAAASAVGGEPWDRLSYALRKPCRTDCKTIANLVQLTIYLEGLESQISPAVLLGPVEGHLGTVARLLSGSLPETRYRKLCSLAGEIAGLAGWLTWDLEQRPATAGYFKAGLEAAKEADDHALGAYLVGSSVVQPAYRERPIARLKRLQGRTHSFVRTSASPSTRAWLITLEAEAYALARQEKPCLNAFDAADKAMAQRSAEDEVSRRPRVAFFDPVRLMGERGVALVRLGNHPEAAQSVLRQALAALDPSVVKTRPRLLSALATAHLQRGDVDEACRLGMEALRMSAAQEVKPNLQDVRKLRLDLQPFRKHPAVKELDEQLRLVA
jgi:transcriptional regulator with XRE-family HTH domain